MSEPLTNYHPHSRFRILDKPGAYPGLDIIHNTHDGPVIDLGVDMDNAFGVGYLQVADILEMARVLGYVTREEAELKDARIAELESQVNHIPNKVESFTNELRNTVDRFVSGLSDVGSTPVDHPEAHARQIGDPEISPANAGATAKKPKRDNKEARGTDGQSDGSTVVEGSDELSGNSVDELLSGFSFDS
jgi:hypothetical protein